jgi:hypothetical protein
VIRHILAAKVPMLRWLGDLHAADLDYKTRSVSYLEKQKAEPRSPKSVVRLRWLLRELRRYVVGWLNYFGISQTYRMCPNWTVIRNALRLPLFLLGFSS